MENAEIGGETEAAAALEQNGAEDASLYTDDILVEETLTAGTAETETQALSGEPEETAGFESETSAQEASAAVRQTTASYVIKEGDTLADICTKYYGSLDRLEDICQINEITDANLVVPGQKIVLP